MKTSGIVTSASVALLMSAGSAQATSCRRLSDHYLLICDRTGCQPLFRAVEVPGYSDCRRTLTIVPFPEWAKAPILEVVKESTETPEHPIVTAVEMDQRYRVPATEDELTRAMSGWAEPRVVQHAEDKDEVLVWYQRRRSADVYRNTVLTFRDCLMCGAALCLLIGTFAWLVRRFRRREPSLHAGILARALIVDVGLIALVIGLSVFVRWTPSFLVLLAPVAVVFIFLELAIYVLGRWLWRRADRA